MCVLTDSDSYVGQIALHPLTLAVRISRDLAYEPTDWRITKWCTGSAAW